MAIRHLTVAATVRLTPNMVRVTLTGDDLTGFVSLGPTDHVKLFFPDPATGVLTTPQLTPDGVRRPTDAVIISRDYTPRAFRADAAGGPELDVDFVLHPSTDSRGAGAEGGIAASEDANGGPASAWASRAQAGDPLAVAGPRGSRLVPDDAENVVLIADETALPAFSRWLELLPAEARITGILDVADEDAEAYLTHEQRARASIEVLYRIDGPGQLEESVRSLDLDDDTYEWAAGEANGLVPVRRYLRHELGIENDRLSVEGYWRRGVTNLDHHAPIDPSDPD
jgi:NADPH-dependent ferric siderophore reductase